MSSSLTDRGYSIGFRQFRVRYLSNPVKKYDVYYTYITMTGEARSVRLYLGVSYRMEALIHAIINKAVVNIISET